MAEHRIAAVHFERRTNDGPCVCSCGESMPASLFADHRKSNGQSNGNTTIGRDAAYPGPAFGTMPINGNIGYCKNGHRMTPDNLYVAPHTTHRRCLACRREAGARGRIGQRVAA